MLESKTIFVFTVSGKIWLYFLVQHKNGVTKLEISDRTIMIKTNGTRLLIIFALDGTTVDAIKRTRSLIIFSVDGISTVDLS